MRVRDEWNFAGETIRNEPTGVVYAVIKGEKIAREGNYRLLE